MSWYGAKILLNSFHNPNRKIIIMRDESIRLISAPSSEEAEKLAIELGKTLEHSYQNNDGETIYWGFDSVLEIQEICEGTLEHGVEIFSELTYMGSGE